MDISDSNLQKKGCVIPALNLNGLDDITASQITNAYYVISRIFSLCKGDVRQPRQGPDPILIKQDQRILDYEAIVSDIRARFYLRIGRSIESYLDWLGGYGDTSKNYVIAELQSLQSASISSGNPSYTTFADIYHLCSLLIATIDRTSQRALIHNVPPPEINDRTYLDQFHRYLSFRARGDDNHRGRPFLWPSAIGYVRDCLPGPLTDAIVSMPTGSGKSYIAELAISHALSKGWVLYLAPTNALAHQIRHDLIYALSDFEDIKIRAFVGSEEYTTLLEEQIRLPRDNFVAVMTPEKCALAIRLYPDQFINCSLCVFDECHLINEQDRGVTADVLIAQLSLTIPNIRFLLMSAMVSNPDEIAEWLSSIHNVPVEPKPLTIKWRPSRTLRGLLVVDGNSLQVNHREAKLRLDQLPARRVNQKFETPLALIAGLSGPWSFDGSPDYRVTRLPINFPAVAIRTTDSAQFDSWKNTSSRLLAEMFARFNIPTICFILTSRHHTFSLGERVIGELPNSIGQADQFPPLVEAWLSISDAELGMETALRTLLRRGIAVHSSAMLPTEQLASEWMFSHKLAPLIFATATLAQGLNLPATAVVIAGTSMGDQRTQNDENNIGTNRVNAMILNGFGRAGRPGFSNQGIAVLVSDNPFSAPIVEDLNPNLALEQYGVLGAPDAAIEVHSPVERFIDNIFSADTNIMEATSTELTLTSLLAEYQNDDYHSGLILSHTFAGFHKRRILDEDTFDYVRARINMVRSEFLEQPNAPEWINRVAMEAGVDFFRALHIWQAYNVRGIVSLEDAIKFDVLDWLNIFFEIMALLPPQQVISILPGPDVRRNTTLTRMRRLLNNREFENLVPWNFPEGWLDLWRELKALIILYMHGTSYIEIAGDLLGLLPEEMSNKRTKGDDPIPAIFSFIHNVVDQLAITAGCFSAMQKFIYEQHGNDEANLPETLQALPLCIKNGCDTLGSLSWFRFGYRQRICAHILENTFPVPVDLNNDTERANWVRQARQDWLSGRLDPNSEPILTSIKTILVENIQ